VRRTEIALEMDFGCRVVRNFKSELGGNLSE